VSFTVCLDMAEMAIVNVTCEFNGRVFTMQVQCTECFSRR
jgi:hypothetical protein